MRLLIPLSIAGALLSSASLASANPKKDAAKHFANGLRLYAEKDFDAAATELEAAYKLNNDQTTLFAWAQAERLYGNCTESKELLSQYISNGANAKQSKAAFDLMDKCTPRVVDEPVEPEVVGGNPDGTGPTDAIPSEGTTVGSVSGSSSQASVHWYKDWVGLTLLSVGGVSTALSLFSYSAARTKEKDADKDGVTYDEFLNLRSDAETSRTLSVVFGVAGGLALGAGAVYIFTDYLSGGSDKESASEGMVLNLDGNGGSVSFSGTF